MSRTSSRLATCALSAALLAAGPAGAAEVAVERFALPSGSVPQAVAPARDGGVWYTAQFGKALGRLDPATGRILEIPLGKEARPHGVVVGPDGAPWVTDGGLNAVLRVDPKTHEVASYPLPAYRGYANLISAAFDAEGTLWFTGQSGVYGRLDPDSGAMQVFRAPRGPGPYGITATPEGEVWFASTAGDYIARIDTETGAATVVDVPVAEEPELASLLRPEPPEEEEESTTLFPEEKEPQGPRRVAADAAGRIWVTQYDAGELSAYDPATGTWREWQLSGLDPKPDALHVDQDQMVWFSEASSDNLVRFDPETERFETFRGPGGAVVRQIAGRPGEVWAADSGTDSLVVLRTR